MTQETPTPTVPSLDTDTMLETAHTLHEALHDTLGSLGRPSEMEIANALYEQLSPYEAEVHPDARYATIALLDGRLMLVIDHEAWAYQVFAVASHACPLPPRPHTAPTAPSTAAVDGLISPAKE